MPSPPPRKVKPAVWLREIHSKQLGSLQTREQQLLDIIEDIRLYSKQRADIERLYGQSLLKLSSQLLAKKELFLVEEKNPSEENRTIQAAWKSCLEEAGKVGNVRLKAAEIYTQNVSERCRVLKGHKSVAVKRALDQLNSLQTDLTQAVKEFGATHKQYTDDEIQAYEARTKATNADQRLNNKDTGLFSSVNTLKKSQVKSFAKMQQCNSQSTTSRNTYLLELSAINAHTNKLHTKHIPTLFKMLDDGVYDQLSNCISVLGQTEIDCCSEIQSSHGQVVSDCAKVTPQYNLDCFLQANPVFSEQLTFHFEPVQDDPINQLSTEYGEQQRLEKETTNWARKVARETRALADLHDKINQLTNKTVSVPGSASDATLEAEVVKMQAHIRRSEIAKLKAEARLELLRTANMPVDEILTQATTEHESVADTHSLTSRDSSMHSADTFDSADNLDSLNRHSYIPGTVSDPANWTSLSSSNHNQVDNLSTSQDSALSTVRVIYDYTASQQDELSLTEGELLSILDHGAGDGWLRASNSSGMVGMVPENYIEQYEDVGSLNENNSQSADPGDTHADSVSSYPPAEQAAPHYDPPPPLPPSMPPPPIQTSAHATPSTAVQGIGYVRALYDYTAEGEDEISFTAGQLIVLLSRDENGIDDGYWKGDVNGVQGMFPSIVVEDVDDILPSSLASGPVHTPDQCDNNINIVGQHPSAANYTWQHAKKPLKRVTFNTWSETYDTSPQQHTSSDAHPYTPPPPPPPSEQHVAPLSASQTFAGSYHNNNTQNSSTSWSTTSPSPSVATTPTTSSHIKDNQGYRPAPLPVIPDEEEPVDEQLDSTDQSEQTMSLSTELYPSNPSPRVIRHRGAVSSPAAPPVVNRSSKPIINSSSLNGDKSHVAPTYPPKPTVNYTTKPTIETHSPREQHSPHSSNEIGEKPVGRRAQRQAISVPAGVVPATRATPAPPAAKLISYGQNSDTPDRVRPSNANYEELQPLPDSSIRDRYPAVRHSRPQGLPVESVYADSSDDVEGRRFRQMQPVPHQYYMDHASSRVGDLGARDRALSGRGSDSNLLRDRSSSDRSFASLSSSDSMDDKQTPIRRPGMRHLSSSTPSDPPTPVTPLSLRDAARMQPQGLVNPSYRVATMSDLIPSPSSRHSSSSLHNTRPIQPRPGSSRRVGGLPGHVRQGIVQDELRVKLEGRQMLADAASDLPAGPANAQSKKRQPHKSETAV